MTVTATPGFCERCGAAAPGQGGHRCPSPVNAFDPPRFCPTCGRRLVVQVLPQGFTAACSRHGTVARR